MTAQTGAEWSAGDDPAAQHLTLHARYLESQLHVAEALLGLVAEHGLDHPRLPQIAEAVKDQSVAIGGAHARAAEVLARLTELELGAEPAAVTPTGFASMPTWAAPAATNGFPLPIGSSAAAAMPTVEAAAAVLTQPPPAAQPAPAAQPGPSPAVDAGTLRAALIAIVAEKTGYPPDLIDPGMDLEADLGVDSIKRVQVIGAVQERFAGLPAVGPEQLSEMRSLDQVVDFMIGAAGDADPKAPSPAAEAGPAPESPGTTGVAGSGSPEEPAPVPRYPVGLTDLPTIDLLSAPYPGEPVALLVHHGGADATVMADALVANGWTVRDVSLSAAGAQAGHTGQAGRPEHPFMTALAGPVNAVILLFADGHPSTWADAMGRLAEAVLLAKHAQGPLTASRANPPGQVHRAAFITVTRLDGRLGLAGSAEPETALLGGVAGVTKTLAIEAPGLFCRALDIDPRLDPGTAAAVLLDELRDTATDTLEVGVDATRARRTVTPSRYHLNPDPAPASAADTEPAEPVINADDVFVVTGGGRGITALCVAALAELPPGRRPAEFILLGRTELAAEPEWAEGIPDTALRSAVIAAATAGAAESRPAPSEIERRYAALAAQREIRATLAKLAAAGVTARYLAVDVTDADAVRAAVASDPAGHRITGVIHGAGVLADALLADKTPDQVERVLRPKLGGLSAVLAAAGADTLRHVVLFTSVAGLFGNAGQADYAAANEAIARFAASWKHRHPGTHVTAIDWGAWDAGMVTPSLRAALTARGVPLLDPAAGARAFAGQFTGEGRAHTRVLVGANKALSAGPPTSRAPLLARREIFGVAGDEVIRAHRIGGHEVLPATFGLGWLINVAERAYPGTLVARATDFQVFRGIVFDASLAKEYWIRLDNIGDEDKLVVRATVHSEGANGRTAPHYGATLELAAGPQPGRRAPVPVPGDGHADGLTLYTSSALFHAPRLQGIREILEFTPHRLAVRCRLADSATARGAYAGALHSPVLTDLLSQGASVLSGRFAEHDGIRDRFLPLAIAAADYHAPLPGDEDFFVVFDQPRAAGAGVSVDATATDRAGRALVCFTAMALVATPDMAAKFAEAVERWRGPLARSGDTA